MQQQMGGMQPGMTGMDGMGGGMNPGMGGGMNPGMGGMQPGMGNGANMNPGMGNGMNMNPGMGGNGTNFNGGMM